MGLRCTTSQGSQHGAWGRTGRGRHLQAEQKQGVLLGEAEASSACAGGPAVCQSARRKCVRENERGFLGSST